jgi:hypothetical protein
MGEVEARFGPFKDSVCNTSGVCHQLSSGFEIKPDRLSVIRSLDPYLRSGDEGVTIKSMEMSPNLNLDNTPLLTCWPFSNVCLSSVNHGSFMSITLISSYLDHWKSFMKIGAKKSYGMISVSLLELHCRVNGSM